MRKLLIYINNDRFVSNLIKIELASVHMKKITVKKWQRKRNITEHNRNIFFFLKSYFNFKNRRKANYSIEKDEILQQKVGAQMLSKTFFRFNVSFLDAKNQRFIIGALA